MSQKCKNKSCRALAYQHLTGPGRSEAPRRRSAVAPSFEMTLRFACSLDDVVGVNNSS